MPARRPVQRQNTVQLLILCRIILLDLITPPSGKSAKEAESYSNATCRDGAEVRLAALGPCRVPTRLGRQENRVVERMRSGWACKATQRSARTSSKG